MYTTTFKHSSLRTLKKASNGFSYPSLSVQKALARKSPYALRQYKSDRLAAVNFGIDVMDHFAENRGVTFL